MFKPFRITVDGRTIQGTYHYQQALPLNNSREIRHHNLRWYPTEASRGKQSLH